MNNLTPHEAAVWWAGRGLAVFPLIAKSKAPAVATGFLAATTDINKINDWWTRRPSCGVGVAIPDGLIVTDFDALAHEHLSDTLDMELPETFYTTTPGRGGGRHFWWRLPLGVVIPPMVEAMPGMDIRTRGSYVVVPPSEHPDGGFYGWPDDCDIDTLDINQLPMCPAWVIESCMSAIKPVNESRERMNLLSMLNGIEPGARQAGLFRAACSMRARGFEKDEAIVILEGIARASEGSGYRQWPDLKALVGRVWKRYEGGKLEKQSRIYTATELLSSDLGDINWFVDDLLAPGLGMIYADEKVGKSMMAANLAYQVCTREKVWGRFVVPKARGVLYLDLEQSALFGQKRWRTIFDGRTPPANLRLAFEWPRMGDGGLELIKEKLNLNPDIDVVIVDIFSLFRPTAPPPGQNAYDMDNFTLAELKKVANQYKVLILIVHHTNKGGDYSGSRGMGGSQDYMFKVSREDGSRNGVIEVKGKNIPARRLYADVDVKRMKWTITGEE